MKLGIVIYSDDPETVYNGFRLANFSLKKNDDVKVFLLAKGVEAESLTTEQFNIKELMQSLIDNNGEIYACGTCLKIRNSEGTKLCPMSTMADLYNIIDQSDRIISL
mgnify:CR=1 FL=1